MPAMNATMTAKPQMTIPKTERVIGGGVAVATGSRGGRLGQGETAVVILHHAGGPVVCLECLGIGSHSVRDFRHTTFFSVLANLLRAVPFLRLCDALLGGGSGLGGAAPPERQHRQQGGD